MDITIKADQVSIASAHQTYAKTIELEITGADESFIKEVSKQASIDDLLSGKTESEIRKWVINEYDWVENLLNEFWQRSSDACPLDVNEADRQESDFVTFVRSL